MATDCRRFRDGREASYGSTGFVDEEFGEVPFDTASKESPEASSQQPKNGMGTWAIDIDLFEQRKRDPEFRPAGLLHFIVGLRLLIGELIAREPEYDQTLILVLPIEVFEALELWR